MESSVPCALCVAVADATGTEESLLFNRNLHETEHFVVVPSIGPFLPGHVLVVSKTHHPSLASMGRAAVEEYDVLAAQLLTTAPGFGAGVPLEAEHGATASDKAGACVIHTHVHWIPGVGMFFDDLAARLARLPYRTLADMASLDRAYIFLRARERQAVFDGRGLPSQTVRRLLCELIDRDDDDWRRSLRSDWVTATVDEWLRERRGR